ncbi:MAG: hypothetical protein IPP49_15450 [Saprospiraceae bacterium]|nr:hypothetical protein [Saprospiraceae bacterium]
MAGAEYIIRIYGTQADFGLEKGMGLYCCHYESRCPYTAREKSSNYGAQAEAECQITKYKSQTGWPDTNYQSEIKPDVWLSLPPSMDGDYKFSSGQILPDAVALLQVIVSHLWSGNQTSMVRIGH